MPACQVGFRLLEIRFDFGCRGLGLGQALLHLRRRGHAGRNFRMIKFGDGGADGGTRARDILAPVANDVCGVEDKEEERNEDEAPFILQVETMQAHEAGAEPEHVSDEERRASGNAAPVARAGRSTWRRAERRRACPSKANGAAQTEGWASVSPNSPRPQQMADVSDLNH